MKQNKHDKLEETFETEPMPYVAILGPFMNLYSFTSELLRKIAKGNDLEPDEYIQEVNDDNRDVMSDAHYVIDYHMKEKVRESMDKQIDTYAGGIFKDSKQFMEKCKDTGNQDIAEQLLDIFEKNKDKMRIDDMFDTMKEIKETLEEDEQINKLVDEDYKLLNPDTDLKN